MILSTKLSGNKEQVFNNAGLPTIKEYPNLLMYSLIFRNRSSKCRRLPKVERIKQRQAFKYMQNSRTMDKYINVRNFEIEHSHRYILFSATTSTHLQPSKMKSVSLI